ncbi:hypothetical protein GCM10010520_18610 [Rhizobium viscosum]
MKIRRSLGIDVAKSYHLQCDEDDVENQALKPWTAFYWRSRESSIVAQLTLLPFDDNCSILEIRVVLGWEAVDGRAKGHDKRRMEVACAALPARSR